MPEFLRLLLAGALGAAIVLVAGLFVPNSASRDSSAASASTDVFGASAGTDTSRDDIVRGEEVRLANIELSLRRIDDEIAALKGGMGAASASPEVAASSPTQIARQPAGAIVATAEILSDAGLASSDAQAMVERLDALALARLEADFEVRSATGDAAKQARLDRRSIPRDRDAIRDEFGDTAYDQYLYALKQPNRVEVSSVLRDSTAQTAGVESGDYLRSLDGEPLYSVRDLTQRIRQGDASRTYSLVVERNGERIETWVPGGPLGVRVTGSLAEPEG